MAKRKSHKKKKKVVRKSAPKPAVAAATAAKSTRKTPAKKSTPSKNQVAPSSVDLAEDLTEPVPHEAITDPKIAKALLIVVGVLVVVVGILWFAFENTKQQQINNVQNQDKLPQVTPGSSDSLQPNSGNSLSNPQSSTSPQPNTTSGSDLQPQQPTTPAQLNQLQQ